MSEESVELYSKFKDYTSAGAGSVLLALFFAMGIGYYGIAWFAFFWVFLAVISIPNSIRYFIKYRRAERLAILELKRKEVEEV